jgi:LacI family transcriptional regulator
VYRALKEKNLRIPDDISVAGWNDTEGAILDPPLTTVRSFPEGLGRHMAELLLKRIADPHRDRQHVVIPTQLVKRESCQSLGSAADSINQLTQVVD